MTDNPATQHKHLGAAFVAALAELTNPPKNAKANLGHGKPHQYADLASILNLVRPVLAKHGLAVTQDVSLDDGRLGITTTVHHLSGDVLRFGPLTGPLGGKWQEIGTAITYARRYALCAALGIAGDDDNDAPTAPETEPERFAPDSAVKRWSELLRSATTVDELNAVGAEIKGQPVKPAERKALQDLYAHRVKELEVPDAV